MKKSFAIRIFLAIFLTLCIIFENSTSLDRWLITRHSTYTIPILGFHDIKQNKLNSNLDYRSQDLEELLVYLIQEKFTFLNTEDLLSLFNLKNQSTYPEKPIMLSFDDGKKESFKELDKILTRVSQRYNTTVKIVLFVNPKNFLNSQNYVSCSNLLDASSFKFLDIQSHGLTHQDLTGLSRTEVLHEAVVSKEKIKACQFDTAIKQNYGLSPENTSIAYPYNQTNSQVIDIIRKHYKSAYTYTHNLLHLGWHQNKYLIPRIRIRSTDSIDKLKRIVNQASGASRQRHIVKFKRTPFHLFLDFM